MSTTKQSNEATPAIRLQPDSRDWQPPTLDQWAVMLALTVLAAAIAAAVPHVATWLEAVFLVALCCVAGLTVLVTLAQGGGK